MPEENQGPFPHAELPATLSAPVPTGAVSSTETLQATTLTDLMKLVLTNPALAPKEKKMLLNELRKNNANSADRWTYRSAIWILGGAVLLSIVALWVLSGTPRDIPDGLIALGSSSAGGLAGLLAPGRSTESNPS